MTFDCGSYREGKRTKDHHWVVYLLSQIQHEVRRLHLSYRVIMRWSSVGSLYSNRAAIWMPVAAMQQIEVIWSSSWQWHANLTMISKTPSGCQTLLNMEGTGGIRQCKHDPTEEYFWRKKIHISYWGELTVNCSSLKSWTSPFFFFILNFWPLALINRPGGWYQSSGHGNTINSPVKSNWYWHLVQKGSEWWWEVTRGRGLKHLSTVGLAQRSSNLGCFFFLSPHKRKCAPS